eukprot:2734523-Rhodomonas_salina.3
MGCDAGEWTQMKEWDPRPPRMAGMSRVRPGSAVERPASAVAHKSRPGAFTIGVSAARVSVTMQWRARTSMGVCSRRRAF